MQTLWFTALCENLQLKTLDLSFNNLRSLEPISRLMRSSECCVHELLLGFQNLWQTPRIEISSIVGALYENKSVRVFGIANNKLSDQDADVLVTALLENSTLEQLDIRENHFHDQGMIKLAHVAKESKSLRKLLVARNPFGTGGSLALLEAVAKNHRIFYIDVCRNDAIDRQIHYNTTLNRAGRRLLLERPWLPLALWPLVLERANNIDWDDDEYTRNLGQQTTVLDPRIEILHHILQRSPIISEGIISKT
jgi:hypothetical protein